MSAVPTELLHRPPRRWTRGQSPTSKLLERLAPHPAVMRYIGDGTPVADARIAEVGAHCRRALAPARLRLARRD